MSLKILHCAETIKGGIASYLEYSLPFQFSEFGNKNVLAIVPKSQIADISKIDKTNLATFFNFKFRALNAFLLALKAVRVARKWKPDIIHIHSTYGGVTVRPFLFIFYRKARVIYCAHGWCFDRDVSSLTKRIFIFLEKFLSNLCEKIICVSQHDYNLAISNGFRSNQLVTIQNGIPDWKDGDQEKDSKLKSETGEKLKLLFVGRFDKQKGIDILNEALWRLGDEVSATIVGESVLGDSKDVVFPKSTNRIGWVSKENLLTLFQANDVLVVPSRWEGLTLVAIEAMSCGLAVLATNVGGLKELIQDKVTGILIEPNSSEKILEAIWNTSIGKWREMGIASRKRFLAHFTIDRVHRELCSVYFSRSS